MKYNYLLATNVTVINLFFHLENFPSDQYGALLKMKIKNLDKQIENTCIDLISLTFAILYVYHKKK
jgi:hypothetical protein